MASDSEIVAKLQATADQLSKKPGAIGVVTMLAYDDNTTHVEMSCERRAMTLFMGALTMMVSDLNERIRALLGWGTKAKEQQTTGQTMIKISN